MNVQKRLNALSSCFDDAFLREQSLLTVLNSHRSLENSQRDIQIDADMESRLRLHISSKNSEQKSEQIHATLALHPSLPGPFLGE